jgi:transglutaminase-like putative cysteine protease
MLTIDIYLASSIDSSVRMSWVQLNDAEFALDTGDLSTIPPDLARIAAMLQSTSFTEKEGPYGPASSDQQVEGRLEQEREALAKRFLDVRWEADADGGVTSLIVSGQIPIYDDVESVSPQVNVQANSTYLVRGSETTATEDELRGASTTLPDWVVQRYLQLPDTISTRTAELASEITADAPTAYDKAKAVETYLRQTITYDTSIEAPPGDQDVVDYLLFEYPRGYCEQYATAMAVMLRSVGIPARIVSGYAPGDFDEERGGYLYLQSNAHAWVEVFFPGYGWVPFEPTSSEAPRTLGDDAASGDIPEDQQIEEIEPTATAENDDDFAAVSTPESSAGQGLATIEEVDDDRGGGGDLAVIIGGALLTIVAVGGMAWWMWMRRLRGLSLSAGLFARLLRVGRMMGVSKQPSATPREYAQTFSQRAPVVSEYAQRIVDAYELDQYAQHGSEGRAIETARQAWRRARTKLLPAMLRRVLPHRNKRQR